MEFLEVSRGDMRLRVAVEGEGPVLLCVHGWPELWYSWRHQMRHFAARGYRVAAMDVRGYGGSSKPDEVAAYTMKELTADVATVARALSSEPVVLLGHDWGAPIVWNTAVMHPEVVRGVAGLSVPYLPGGDVMILDLWEALYPDRFFYQLYFQQPGLVESEVAADYRGALRRIYYALSGNAPEDEWLKVKPRSAGLLDDLTDPQPFPDWMSEQDLDVYVEAFAAGGFRGPINRYRAQALDFQELVEFRGSTIRQPSCFIGGAKDAVRHFVPGGDFYTDPGAACEDFRGATIIPRIGHWVQQEAPLETNAALEVFLGGVFPQMLNIR
ncbi:MAG: alpha/beta fold hydrolase [Pseudomonadales bacterium]